MLIANSLLVPKWATWDEFRRLEAEGLTMFGQMTAGSWIYIGTQGILQGTYQTFAAAGEKHFGSADLRGRTILTAGLGGMGGAQPLAATMAGAAILCIEVDPQRIERRLETRYLDEATDSLDDALARIRAAAARAAAALGRPARQRGRARAGARGARRAVRPRHRPDRGARPAHRLRPARAARSRRPTRCARPIRTSTCGARASRSHGTSKAMLEYVRRGAYVFDYGNNLRGEAREAWRSGGLLIPGLRPGLYPAALLSRHRAVSLGRAVRRSGGHRDDRRGAARSCSPTIRCCSAGSSSRPSGSRSRGCPRGSAGSATATARRRGSRSTSSCGAGRSRRRS